jgi:hypothetical protein
MNTFPEPKNILIVIGSEGFMGSRFIDQIWNTQPEKIFLVDPKLKRTYNSFLQKKISNNTSLGKCLESINVYFSSRKSLRAKYKIIIVNFGGVTRKGKYKNDFEESLKFNTNTEIAVEICHLIGNLLNINQVQKILMLQASTNGLFVKDQLSGYEYSKLAQEHILKSFTSFTIEGRLYLVIFRLCDVYGDINYHEDKVVNQLVSKAKLCLTLPYLDKKIDYNPIHVDFVVLNLVQIVFEFLDENLDKQISLFKYKPKLVFKLKSIQKFALSLNKGDVEKFLIYWSVFSSAKFRFYLLLIQSKLFLFLKKQSFQDRNFLVVYDKTKFLSWIKKEVLNG